MSKSTLKAEEYGNSHLSSYSRVPLGQGGVPRGAGTLKPQLVSTTYGPWQGN